MSSPDSNEKMLAMFAHLSILVAGVIGPLIIWMIKKEESPYIERHAKEALNFQLAVLIVSAAAGFGSFVTFGLSALVIPVVALGGIIFGVIAGVAANEGKDYQYPVTFRLIR